MDPQLGCSPLVLVVVVIALLVGLFLVAVPVSSEMVDVLAPLATEAP
jgi:hypothetical protein